MANIPTDAPVPLVEPTLAPDIYADGVAGWFLLNGNVRITLVSTRVNHISSPGPAQHVVVGRIVMAEAQAEILARGLLEFIEKQRSNQGQTAQGTFTVQ